MKEKARLQELGDRLFLLLFFLIGALLLRFVPSLARSFVPSGRMPGLLMLLPALLAGSLLGAYVLPFGAMLLGMLCMQKMTALGVPGAEGLAPWLLALLPLLLLTPAYYALAYCGMRLSEACAAEYRRADSGKRKLLARRQLLIALCAAAAIAANQASF